MSSNIVYVLYSEKLRKYYTGFTSRNVEERLDEHNNAVFNKAYTAKGIPWTIVFTIQCMSTEQGLLIEKHIKSMKSKTYIENLIKYPDIAHNLLNKY